MKEIFNERYATISFCSKKNRLYLIWKGFATKEEHKKALGILVEWAERKKVQGIFTDSSTQRVIAQESLCNAVRVTEQMFKSELRYIGVVQPKDDFIDLLFKSYVDRVKNSGVHVRYFETGEEVEAWLDRKLSKNKLRALLFFG